MQVALGAAFVLALFSLIWFFHHRTRFEEFFGEYWPREFFGEYWPVVVLGMVILSILGLLGYTVGSGALGFGPHEVKKTEKYAFPQNGDPSAERRKVEEAIETQSYRTIWDWMTVVTVSAVLAFVAVWFSNSQAEEQQRLQQQQAEDDVLVAYLDTMSRLIFDRDLHTSEVGAPVREVAQASTLVVLGNVGPDHKRSIVKFLYESGLIKTETQIVDLTDANLLDANLTKVECPGIDLSDANLRDGGDDNPIGANLEEANLEAANLQEANLRAARLVGAFLVEANLSDGEDGNKLGANLRKANLEQANLQGANLSGATLQDANLQGANLEDAILRDGASENANNKLLNQQGASLKGATMPDGQQYEEWLKEEGDAGGGETAGRSG